MIKFLIKKNNWFLYFSLLAYFIISATFLMRFPFIHSDEPWLSGLSRNILEKGDFSVTEAFFDLKERNPHAIKILFHSMQILFIKVFGYGIFSIRMLSLVFGMLSLIYFYKLSQLVLKSDKAAFISTVLLGLDIQFIYASHFARQEIIILFVLIISLYYFITNIYKNTNICNIITGIIIGLSIGIHPNSFIISIPFVFIYLYNILITKKLRFSDLFTYCFILAVFAAVFIGISLSFDPDFFTNYSKYGSNEFDIFEPVTSKAVELKYFYQKLFYGVSGTYYTPFIKLQFILFPAAFLITSVRIYLNRKLENTHNIAAITITILAINIGLVIVGRYNQTSIIFIFPLFYILVSYSYIWLSSFKKNIVSILLISAISINSLYNVAPWLQLSYKSYLDKISVYVEKDAPTLGNINLELYFENGKLYDYRNLAYLDENNISLEDYIRNNNIKYIIYSEELDLIYSLRPNWNGIYGALTYLDEFKLFLNNKCDLIGTFTDKTYGVRIVRYINNKDWELNIYKVK